jgi:transcriptional regulator with XRE-family HTH domain
MIRRVVASVNAKRMVIILFEEIMTKGSSLVRAVGQRIRDLRTHYGGGLGMSQEELARAIGTTANTVSRWETGVYKPSVEDLERLARHFGTSITAFFPAEEAKADEPINALLRAASGLSRTDIDELRRYAEFRKMRAMLKRSTAEESSQA